MSRYLHRVAWIASAVAALLASGQEARSEEQLAAGGLYRDGELVDSFVESFPTSDLSVKIRWIEISYMSRLPERGTAIADDLDFYRTSRTGRFRNRPGRKNRTVMNK